MPWQQARALVAKVRASPCLAHAAVTRQPRRYRMHGARRPGELTRFIDRSRRRIRSQVHNLFIAIVLVPAMAGWAGWAALDMLRRAWVKRKP